MSELLTIIGVGCVVYIPILTLLLALIGYAVVGIGLGFMLSLLSVLVAAKQLSKMKRGRPIGYYQLQIILFLHDKGIKKRNIIRRSGAWRIGRTHDQKQV